MNHVGYRLVVFHRVCAQGQLLPVVPVVCEVLRALRGRVDTASIALTDSEMLLCMEFFNWIIDRFANAEDDVDVELKVGHRDDLQDKTGSTFAALFACLSLPHIGFACSDVVG